MCCFRNNLEEEKFRTKIKKWKKSHFYAWKVVKSTGGSFNGKHQYRPGVHRYDITEKTYNVYAPRGLHVFLTHKEACNFAEFHLYEFISKVKCNISDLVMIGYGNRDGGLDRQAVVRKLTINKKDWEYGRIK